MTTSFDACYQAQCAEPPAPVRLSGHVAIVGKGAAVFPEPRPAFLSRGRPVAGARKRPM